LYPGLVSADVKAIPGLGFKLSMRAGVDLGGTKIQTVVLDDENRVVAESKQPTPQAGGPTAVAEAIARSVRDAAASASVEPTHLDGVGVGSPGKIENGTVAHARNLPEWDAPFPLASVLSEQLGIPVTAANDVGVAVDAEARLGAGRSYGSFLGAWWGTGVGGAVVLDGRRWLGRGAAGELGHTVVKLGGARCDCGRRGCLEAYAGRAAMERRARRAASRGRKTVLFELMEKHGSTRLTSGIWDRALKHGDELASRIIARAVEALGAGIASAVNLLDVEAVVVGGGLGTRFGQPYADLIQGEMKGHLFVPNRPPAVLTATLGDLGGAIGASLLVGAR
jgi:predicted NBD/HSP70 family sugar kinase